MILTYSELIEIPTFEERLEYLRTDGLPSELTFDNLRYLNQKFYNSRAWKKVRSSVIARDFVLDLAVPGYNITGKILVHHMNPLLPKDIYMGSERALDPEYLITTSFDTHQAIHFGSKIPEPIFELDRSRGDTKLW
jgi:hypothetical protein